MTNAEERFTLTRDGYETLQSELAQLEAQGVELQANFVDENYSNDPTPDEAGHFDAQTEKERNEERIGHLKLVLENADVIDDTDPATADPGDRVTVYDFGEKQTMHFDLRGGEEVIAGLDGVPVDSPVGKALNGRRVGDVVEVTIPDGKVRYAIRKIEPIPE